ncbi:MAG: hypothetical protein C4547_13200 [Phycisphaerales bacterium]|nr:MAG: hypothetical protein C4547_13200 [Phycisphaerales bacterium]
MRDDSHPPVYFILLYAWRRLWGAGDVATRLPSILISALSIVPVVLLCRLHGAGRIGLVIGGILAISHAHILAGQQARPYALSIALISTAYWLFEVMGRRWSTLTRRGRWIAACSYGACLLAAMMTHYFAALALFGHVLIAVIRWRGSLLRAWLAAVAASAALFAVVWGPSLAAQLDFIGAQDWLMDTAPDHVRRTLLRAASLPLRLTIARPLPDWTSWNIEIEALAGLAILVQPAVLLWRRRVGAPLPFAVWALLPILILTAVDLTTGKELLTHARYSCIAAPGVVALIVLGVGQCPRRTTWLAVAAGVTIVGLTLRPPAIHTPHARRAAAIVDLYAGPDDLVVFDAIGWTPPYWARREFIQVRYYMRQRSAACLLLEDAMSDDTKADACGYRRIILVSPRMEGEFNPCPTTHQHRFHSPWIFDIGWVDVFEIRNPP